MAFWLMRHDAEDFANKLRSMTVTPHAAQNTSGRSSAVASDLAVFRRPDDSIPTLT